MIYGETINIDSPMFRRLTNDAQILVQSIEMRLKTQRGFYFDDPEYGLDLAELIYESATPATVARIGATLAAEIEKDDDRIESVSVRASVVPSGSASKLSFTAAVTPRTAPPFSLVIAIQDLTIDVLLRGA